MTAYGKTGYRITALRRLGLPLGLLLLLICTPLKLPAAGLAGNPPFTRFTPDIDVYPQNFAVTEDADSIVYVGNSQGVLTFDGSNWKLVRLPNSKWARSLAFDGHQRVYVGGYSVFGYIEHDAAGQPVFHDLTPKFKTMLQGDPIADIWSIRITPLGVVFQAVSHLFLYNPADDTARMWRYPGRFGAVAFYQGKLIAQFRGEGLKYLDQDTWRMLPDCSALTQQAFTAIPLGNGHLLFLSRNGSWLEYGDGRVRPFKVPAGFPPSSYFHDGLQLPDGTLVFSSVDGYLYFLSARGTLLRKLRVDDGFLSSVIRGRAGGLLVSADQALIHVTWPAAWTMLDSNQGLGGGLVRTVKWGTRWVVMTGAGVYVAENTPEGVPHFKRTDWSEHESWDLLPLDAHSALLADSYALLMIDGTRSHPITHAHLYPRLLLRSRFNRNLVYVGTELGIATLVQHDGRWRLTLDQENVDQPGVTSMVETAPHTLWIGTKQGGAHLLKLSPDDSRIVDDRLMGPADGLDYGGMEQNADVARLPDGTILVSTDTGEFRWQDRKFVPESFGNLAELRNPAEKLVFASSGKALWAFDYNRVFHLLPGSQQWREEPINGIRHGSALQTLTVDPDGGVMLVTNHAILCYNPGVAAEQPAAMHTLLRSVQLIDSDGGRRYLPLDTGEPLQLPQGEFSLTFTFAMPDYSRQDAIRFAARLTGFEAEYSDWAPSRHYTYSHLRAIPYTFNVRGRDAQGRISMARPFNFVVVPEWYASDWARVLWIALLGIVGIVVAFGFVRMRTRRLASGMSLLESMVAERTVELEAANRKLETMAHLDGLTGIANRRRLDDYLEQVWAQCIERQRSLSVLVIDVDHFKQYNDRHGHLAGDSLLKRLVVILSRCLRRTEDLLARYGGEEFLVVLPGAGADSAHALAEQMRIQVEATSLGATISIGVATAVPNADTTAAVLVNAADAALYRAKAAGRNRTVLAEQS